MLAQRFSASACRRSYAAAASFRSTRKAASACLRSARNNSCSSFIRSSTRDQPFSSNKTSLACLSSPKEATIISSNHEPRRRPSRSRRYRLQNYIFVMFQMRKNVFTTILETTKNRKERKGTKRRSTRTRQHQTASQWNSSKELTQYLPRYYVIPQMRFFSGPQTR